MHLSRSICWSKQALGVAVAFCAIRARCTISAALLPNCSPPPAASSPQLRRADWFDFMRCSPITPFFPPPVNCSWSESSLAWFACAAHQLLPSSASYLQLGGADWLGFHALLIISFSSLPLCSWEELIGTESTQSAEDAADVSYCCRCWRACIVAAATAAAATAAAAAAATAVI